MPLSEQEQIAMMMQGREHLAAYAVAQYPWFQLGRHHKVLFEHLEALERGEFKKLMVFAPPQNGKTSSCSELFPSWCMGRHPWWRTIVVSYAQPRADDFGSQIRTNISTAFHQAIFPDCRLNPNVEAKDDFELLPIQGRPKGAVRAAGRKASITGLPADLIVVDDPYASSAEARSEAVKVEVRDLWNTVIDARMHPDTRLLLIQCLAEGTRIPLGNGLWIPIEEVGIDYPVWSFENQGELGERTVLNTRISGIDDVFEVKTARFAIKANARHPFLTLVRETLVYKPLSELHVGDLVVTMRSFPAEHGDEPPKFRERRIDEEFMWLLGFMFGDGWVTKYTKHRKSRSRGLRRRKNVRFCTFESDLFAVCIAMSVYPGLNKRVIEVATDWFGRAPTMTDFGYLRWDYAEVGRQLRALGLVGRAKKKRIPRWVFSLKRTYKRAFLRGLMDADGCPRAQANTYVLAFTNPQLLEDARLLGFECGVRSGSARIYDCVGQPPHSPSPIKYKSCSALFNFEDSLGDMGLSPDGSHETVRFERIKSIEPAGRAPVYDLAIDGPANFVAEGFVVHNTRWDPDDLAGWELDEHPKGWRVLSLPAIGKWVEDLPPEFFSTLSEADQKKYAGALRIPDEADGGPLWPERFPLDFVLEKRDRLTRDQWLSVYQQMPTRDGDSQTFQDSWFRTIMSAELEKKNSEQLQFVEQLRVYIVADPANAKNKRADFTNMWVFGLGLDRKVYVLDGVRDKLDQRERWDALKRLHEKWNNISRVRCVGWEQYSLQSDIQYIREKQKEENYRFEIQPLGGNVRKEDRIRGLVGMFRDSDIYFVSNIPATTVGAARNLTEDFRLIEYLKYPATRHDDMLDSLARIRDMIGLGYATYPTKARQDTVDFYRRRYERLQGTTFMGR